jgi:hypothetical protein
LSGLPFWKNRLSKWDFQHGQQKKTDSRSKSFKGESVKVDAIHPDTLKQMCKNCITQHIDSGQFKKKVVEKVEREGFIKQVEAA